MDLQRISVPLKNITNVSKCNGNALQRKCITTENATTLFSLSRLFPNRVTYLQHLHYCLLSASCLPTKSLKEQTKTCPGQAKFERYMYLSQGQTGILVFFKPRVHTLYNLIIRSIESAIKFHPVISSDSPPPLYVFVTIYECSFALTKG